MSVPKILSEYNSASQDSLPKLNLYQSNPKPTTPNVQDKSKPKVLIAGAGLGGLTLGILLHKGGVPFTIFEKAHEIKPIGSAMVLGAGVALVMKQMGIYEDFVRIGKQYTIVNLVEEDLKSGFVMDNSFLEKATSFREYIFARPDLYDILLRQIPKENICLGKRILSFQQNDNGVMIRCSDNSTYQGDILVGADGAYSAVRQHLYALLKEENRLPKSDGLPLSFNCVCLVGQTEVLDPEEFPAMKREITDANTVLGVENRCTWATFTSAKNTILWVVIQYLDKETSKANGSFRISEWGPEAVEAMCKEVCGFKVPGSKDGKVLTMGDFIDRTPKEMISKVMLEEKLFSTWHSGRTVLLGDACHKMSPAGAAGALTALHDAVALANWIYTLQSPSLSDIDAVFNEYRAERYPVAKAAFKTSQMFGRNLGKSMVSVLVRAAMKRLPVWLWRRILTRVFANRPQVSFLPQIHDNGEVKPIYQASLQKTLDIINQRTREKSSNIA